ncbi:hypothetical protein FOA52_004344 [Chlamydomonas sp. UWO 241]|nr:hypothetical protein FOA52_004344 [Chlamydomonas sp. UWO 241]
MGSAPGSPAEAGDPDDDKKASRSPSRSPSRHSKSKSPSRSKSPRRSRSKSKSPRSRSPSRSKSKSKSRSRSPRGRSSSRSASRSSRSRSRSPRGRSSSRSRSRSPRRRSRSHSRSRSQSPRRGGRTRSPARRSRSPRRRRGSRSPRGRGRAATPPDLDKLEVPRQVQSLFKDAVLALLERDLHRLPTNISKINDIMRKSDRTFHFKNVPGVATFRGLCQWFERQGLIELTSMKDSVMISGSRLVKDLPAGVRERAKESDLDRGVRERRERGGRGRDRDRGREGRDGGGGWESRHWSPPRHGGGGGRGYSPPQPRGRGYSPPPPRGRGYSPPPPRRRGYSPPPPRGRGYSPPSRDGGTYWDGGGSGGGGGDGGTYWEGGRDKAGPGQRVQRGPPRDEERWEMGNDDDRGQRWVMDDRGPGPGHASMMAMGQSHDEPCSSCSDSGSEGEQEEEDNSQLFRGSHSRPRQSQRQAQASKKAKHGSDSEGEGEGDAEDGAGGGMGPIHAGGEPASGRGRGGAHNSKYVAWTTEEDERLKLLVDKYHAKQWRTIALSMDGRTSKSCRLRWLNQLRPGVQTGNFTPQEDVVIIEQQHRLGNRWTTIAAMLPGRTDNSVKNRWNSQLKRRVVDGAGGVAQSAPAAAAQQLQPYVYEPAHDPQYDYDPQLDFNPQHDTQGESQPQFGAQQQDEAHFQFAVGVPVMQLDQQQLDQQQQAQIEEYHKQQLAEQQLAEQQLAEQQLAEQQQAVRAGASANALTLHHQQHEVLMHLLAAAASKTPMGELTPDERDALSAAAAAAAASNVKFPHSLQSLLVNGLSGLSGAPGGSDMLMSLTGPVPAPPPSSVAPVASSPPFQLPVASMSLQPQMTPAQAAAKIALHGGDAIVKKLGEQAVGGSASQLLPASSAARVASSPPPVNLGMDTLPEQAQAAPPLHASLSASQLAQSLLAQTPVLPPATAAMVAGSPPPISMAIHADQPMSKLGTAGSSPACADAGADAMLVKREDLDGSSGPTSDLAQLLLLQQQQLMQQQAMMQRLAMQVQVQQQQADAPTHADATAQADAPAQTDASTQADAPAQGDDAGASLAAVLEAAVCGGGSNGIMRTLQAAMASPGGSEVLQHLVTLGIGTLMTAAQLRGDGADGGPPNALPTAQAQMAGHPSVAVLLPMLGAAPVPHAPHHHTTQRRRSGDAENHSPTGLGFGIGSPLGSFSDLVGLFAEQVDSAKLADGATCFGGGSPRAMLQLGGAGSGMPHLGMGGMGSMSMLGSSAHLAGLLDDDMGMGDMHT